MKKPSKMSKKVIKKVGKASKSPKTVKKPSGKAVSRKVVKEVQELENADLFNCSSPPVMQNESAITAKEFMNAD